MFLLYISFFHCAIVFVHIWLYYSVNNFFCYIILPHIFILHIFIIYFTTLFRRLSEKMVYNEFWRSEQWTIVYCRPNNFFYDTVKIIIHYNNFRIQPFPKISIKIYLFDVFYFKTKEKCDDRFCESSQSYNYPFYK